MSESTAPDGSASRVNRLLVHGWWGVAAFIVGMVAGAHQLSDNSFLTHLATGRLILDSGAPQVDPYSFTVAGTPWVVQSWGASVLYALADLIGPGAIRLFIGIITGLLAAVIWRLTGPAKGLLPRLALMVGSCGVGIAWWSERPQLIAYLLLALATVVVVEKRSAWWMAPIFLVWVNVHGSWPLGLVFVALLALGVLAQSDSANRRERVTWAVTAGVIAAIATLLGGLLSPYGFDQLKFPFEMLQRSDVLQYIVEWRRPKLTDYDVIFFLVLLAASLWAIWRQRAWGWLPLIVVAAGLVAQSGRNVAPAAIVLVPVVAPALAGLGTIDLPASVSLRRAAIPVGVSIVLLGFGLWLVPGGHYDLDRFPVEATTALESEGLIANPDVRVVTPDYAGNYLEWRYGADAHVFLDDRAEVYGFENIRDYVALLDGDVGWPGILYDYDADIVMWPVGEPLADLLDNARGWDVERVGDYVVAIRAT